MKNARHTTHADDPVWVPEVIKFWFTEVGEPNWFVTTEAIDSLIRGRFLDLHEQLFSVPFEAAAATPQLLLASVIVLDQFSRNMFRGTARAFSADPIARRLSRQAIERKLDVVMSDYERYFLYMPFEHSEDRSDQSLAVELISSIGNEDWTRYAIAHSQTIERFGRFPHRNVVLNRPSTPEEIEKLKRPADWE